MRAQCFDASGPRTPSAMVWFFERNGQYLRCEARDLPEGSGYELVITQPNGSEMSERFEDSAELSRRQRSLESGLTAQGWAGPYGRLF